MTAETSPEVKQYQRLKLICSVTGVIIALLFLAGMALAGGPVLARTLNPLLGGNRWPRLLAYGAIYTGAMELLSLPIAFYSGHVLEHRFGLSTQSLAGWIKRRQKGYLVGGVLGMALLAGLYAFLWFSGPWWWIWATCGYLVVTIVLGQLLPVLILPLFYKVTRLEDSALLERLCRLTQGTTLRFEGIYRLHLSEETKKANAALAGLGRTRRVLLGDTLLEQFTPEEIEVVFAHEVGHHVYHHLPKFIVCSVVLTAVSFWLVDVVLRHMAGVLGYPAGALPAYAEPSTLPLLLLVLMLFSLLLSPPLNALSRLFERQCDRYALERTRLFEAYRSAFSKLAVLNKADMDPNPLVVMLFHDHPPIRERLALADLVTSASSA